MANSIWKFRLAPDTMIRNRIPELGDEAARDHILRIADCAGVPKSRIRDRSTSEKIDIDVELEPHIEEPIFKVGCDAPVDRIVNSN
jgi:hypothetical protein